MRRIQTAALGLFEKRGFGGVTIEEVARAAGVSAPTVYRKFRTKEQLVLWDEYDPELFKEISKRLGDSPPTWAVRDAMVICLEQIYRRDKARILRRTRLMTRTPALLELSLSVRGTMSRQMGKLFFERGASPSRFEAEVTAGAIVGGLTCAGDQWVREKGRRPLGRLIDDAMRVLERLGRPSA